MVNALMQDNQQLRAALQQQTAAGNQQSALAENALAGQFTPQAAIPTTPAPVEDVPPQTLNFEELQYMSDDERNKRVLEWQTDVMRYAADQAVRRVREELAPVREDYETKRRMAAEEAAKSVVFADPRFSGLKGEMNEIERIIQSTPMLANAGDPEMKYTLAALLRNGVKYSRQPTSEEIIALVDKNPEVQKALEGRRARAVRDNTGSLPKPQPSSGLSSAAAVPENRPKSYQDVAKKFSQAFGLAR